MKDSDVDFVASHAQGLTGSLVSGMLMVELSGSGSAS